MTKPAFQKINKGYDAIFQKDSLSVGLVVPIENYDSSLAPAMERHVERAQLAEELGFKAAWLRDVPFNVPSFGDTGQLYDPFVYLGFLVAHTKEITLGVASIILPLRHPAHVAKAAMSADVLSGGRLVLGIASGDRPEEYPALNMSFDDRGERFRESFEYIREVAKTTPSFENNHGRVGGGIDMLPKPAGGKIPMLITGGSQQSNNWIDANGDGWMMYPRNGMLQEKIIDEWRERTLTLGRSEQPVMEPVYIDLVDDPDSPPQPIHLGLRLGINHLKDYLTSRQNIGVNHVALNLRLNKANTEDTIKHIADEILPEFHEGESA